MEAIPASDLVPVTGKILCCQCGTPIDPNPANLCVACLRTQVDITEGIPKQVIYQNFIAMLSQLMSEYSGDNPVL